MQRMNRVFLSVTTGDTGLNRTTDARSTEHPVTALRTLLAETFAPIEQALIAIHGDPDDMPNAEQVPL